MALTSNDETDLLLPLYRGVMQHPRFGQFLDRLKRRTRAEHVSIAAHRTGAPFSRHDVSFAGMNLGLPEQDEAGPSPLQLQPRLRPYRVYTLTELAEFGELARRTPAAGAKGIVDMRVVRIRATPEFDGLLCLARAAPCTASDSALLSNLAPYVETALSMLHALERDRFEATLSSQGLVRSGTGWVLFDAEARIVAIETATQQRFASETGIEPRIGERLHGVGTEAERSLADAAAQFARDSRSSGRSALLKANPRVDAVLVPVSAKPESVIGHAPGAVMIAYCRFEAAQNGERVAHLAALFDLPVREAELAIALADGQTIAEAAAAMGLTLETARNYSKRLYAQLGVRGQAGLVRLVHRSSAVLV